MSGLSVFRLVGNVSVNGGYGVAEVAEFGLPAHMIKTGRFTNDRLPLEPQITGNLTPSANSVYSLGNVTHRWKDLYLAGNTLYLGDTVLSAGEVAGTMRVHDISDPGNTAAIVLTQTAATVAGNAVAIGTGAGGPPTAQGSNAVAVGLNAGLTSQGVNAVAVGFSAGQTSQGPNAVAVGYLAGSNTQGSCSVAVGVNAGQTSQGLRSVAIGQFAGNNTQGGFGTALGAGAGQAGQGNNAVAIGFFSGNDDQGFQSVAIGNQAGRLFQKSNAVAIGSSAGYSNQAANCIVINATGEIVNNTTADSCVIKPMRIVNQNGLVLLRETTSGEMYHGTSGATASTNARLDVAPTVQENVYGINTTLPKSDFAGSCIQATATRAANSGYEFLEAYSGGGGDREFNLRGDGNGLCDGAWTGGGADYAEYFESASGNAIPVGTTVVLDGKRVRPAIFGTDAASAIVGVVRPKGMAKGSVTIGNSAWNHWNQKYLTDEYGSYVMEPHEVLEWTDVRKKHEYESTKIPEGVEVPTDGTSVITETRERTEFSTVEYLVWTDTETGVEVEYVKTEVPEDVVVPEDARTDFRTVETTVSYDVVSWTETTTDPDDVEGGEKRSYESWNVPTDVVVPANAVRKTHDDKGNPFVHKKPNPQYDPTVEYVPRENRDEWVVVGLLGQIPVTKGQAMGERWTKMHDVSPNVEMWFVR